MNINLQGNSNLIQKQQDPEEEIQQMNMTSRSIVKQQSSTCQQHSTSLYQEPEIQIVQQVDQRSKYGNLKVFLNYKYLHISLGPDYCIFLVGYSFFIGISFLISFIAHNSTFGETMKNVSYFIACLVPLFYLLTALSNPGVYNPDVDIQSKHRYCVICNFAVSKTVRHCNKCNICVQGYDHHCPWISKCVGKRNIKVFYLFLVSTPITALYLWISIGLFFAKK